MNLKMKALSFVLALAAATAGCGNAPATNPKTIGANLRWDFSCYNEVMGLCTSYRGITGNPSPTQCTGQGETLALCPAANCVTSCLLEGMGGTEISSLQVRYQAAGVSAETLDKACRAAGGVAVGCQ